MSAKLPSVIVEIARKEIGVTEINGTNCGPRVDEYKAATWLDPKKGWPWCFDSSVEILTSLGWEKMSELTDDEMVAQVNPENGHVSFVKPIARIHTRDRMTIATVKTRSLSFRCDARHNFWGYWNVSRYSKDPKLKPISELSSSLAIPGVVSGSMGNPDFSPMDLDFIAAFVADGSLHKRGEKRPTRTRVQVSKERKVEALQKHGGREYVAGRCYGTSTKPLTTFEFEVPPYFSTVFSGYKEIRWEWALSLSAEQAGFFIDRYLFWDGTIKKNVISTTRKQNADVMAALAFLAGRHPNMSTRIVPGKKTCYSITTTKKLTRTIKADHMSLSTDEIDLYCVQVPMGLIVCRDKGGTPFVTGNCAAFICWAVREALLATGTKETKTFKRPRTAGAWDLENWSLAQDDSTWTKKPHRDDILPGDIVVFTFSHVGFAESGPDKNGYVTCIEGNTDGSGSREGGAVLRKRRHKSSIRSRIRFRI